MSFVFLYTREAHPGERRPHHASIEDKLRNARDMAAAFDIRRPMLVDDLAGSVHRAYGSLPNMTYVVGTGGSILYRAAWTDPRTIALALEQLDFEADARKQGTRLTPYYMEWVPQRPNPSEHFMDGLRDIAGERAVTEFIDAIATTHGEGAARPLRAWRQRRDGE